MSLWLKKGKVKKRKGVDIDNNPAPLFLARSPFSCPLPVDETYRSLQRLARHRRNLIKQRARLQIQIRSLMHQAMPGCAELWEDDLLFNKSIAMVIAKQFSSAHTIAQAGPTGMAKYLCQEKIRFQERTLDKIHAWSLLAADPDPLIELLTSQWKQLLALRELMSGQINDTEREMARFLVKTPYCLLLSVTGINVVSAGELAGEQCRSSTTHRRQRSTVEQASILRVIKATNLIAAGASRKVAIDVFVPRASWLPRI